MKNKYIPIFYDLFSIFFVSLLYLSFIEIIDILIVCLFNISLILIFIIINFYKKSSTTKIIAKLKIIFIASILISISKLIFFWHKYIFKFYNLPRYISNTFINTSESIYKFK